MLGRLVRPAPSRPSSDTAAASEPRRCPRASSHGGPSPPRQYGPVRREGRFLKWGDGNRTWIISGRGVAVKVLVIGKGGREHALCWKLKQSPRVKTVYCAPGNAGTALDVQNVPIEPGDFRALMQFAKREGVGLTVVGPEEPLVNGIVDAFQREGLRIFGPRRDAAELEGSKVFAKELMRQAGIPTADYRIFRSAPDAEHYILSREVSLVIRSKGRSTIRNTLLCRTAAESLEAIDRIMDPREMLSPGVQRRDRGARRASGLQHGRRGARPRPGPPARPGPEGRRAGRGQGGLRLRQPPPGPRRHRPDHGPAHLRQGRRPDDPRGAARRPGDEHPGADRRPDDRPAGDRARTTNAPSTTTRGRTPAAWGPIPPRRSSRPT